MWWYNDPQCNTNNGPGGDPPAVFICPGHNVIFEDGSVESPMLRARTYPLDSFSWSVPTTATSGSLIRYFCEPEPGNNHWAGEGGAGAGMTGILRIV